MDQSSKYSINTLCVQMGEMYVCDDRFKKNIDRVGGEGTAEFVREAIFTTFSGR